MKPHYLIIGIPAFLFFALAITLDLGAILPLYGEYDLTPYLAARSLTADGDLAYTREDSDRYFKENLYRPTHFKIAKKRILSGSGVSLEYFVFHDPEVYIFLLAPFAALFHLKSVLFFNAILILALYLIGFAYYFKDSQEDTVLPALNSVVYFTLIPVPILFLLPGAQIFLLTAAAATIYFAIKGKPLIAALCLTLCFSIQPWSLILSVFAISFWKFQGLKSESLRFVFAAAAGVFLVWGMERIMYPTQSLSEVRWVMSHHPGSLSEIWSTLPQHKTYLFDKPGLQRLSDFLFGRNFGAFLYGFPAFALLLSSIVHWKERLVNRGLVFMVLFLLMVCFTHQSGWNVQFFSTDLSLLLFAFPFFLLPFVKPVSFFVAAFAVSSILIGPLLVNPAGALLNRAYYLQAFPYRLFPVELTMIGQVGLPKNPVYNLGFSGGNMYLLNDNFYKENDFVWIRGEASVEFIVQKFDTALPFLKITNGPVDNLVQVSIKDRDLGLRLKPGEVSFVDLSQYDFYSYRGREFLHGKIKSTNGYVPKLLSRDNADYRFLGCQVQPFSKQSH